MTEQIKVKPFHIGYEGYEPRCIVCHAKLKSRKPTEEERQITLEVYRERYDCNICKPEDVWAVTDTCECGQKGLVFFDVNSDTDR